MIVGNRNDKNILSNEIDHGLSSVELSRISAGMTNKDLDDLIGALCETRKNNEDTQIMDQLKRSNSDIPINPIELERINELRESEYIENEILKGLVNDPNITVAEANMMKANGFYDKYNQIKKSEGDIDIMKSIENEIKRDIENDNEMNNIVEDDVIDDNTSIVEENTEVINESVEATEENYTPMSTEEINDVPASELKVDDNVLANKIKESYSSIDDQDTITLLNVMKRYQSGEKFNVYQALPNSVKIEIDKAAFEAGVTDRSIINFFAKNFINDLISDTYIGKEIDDFQNELSTLTSSMGNIPGLIIDTYTDDLKSKFEDNMIEMADKIQDEDSEKADKLREISSNFKASYTLSKVKELYSNKPSFLNRAYKMGRDSYETLKRDFNEKFKDSKPKVKTFESINNALINKLAYPEDIAKAFSALIYTSIMNEYSDNVQSHIYAYYTMLGFININLTANNSEIMIEFCKNIHEIIVDIEKYMRELNNSKKKGKR